MATPIVSVVIATRNRASRLARLLSCVKNQEFADFECVVVDDGSSGETRQAYEEIWKGLDARFSLVLCPQSGGPSRSRNAGISASRGEYIAFCDDDDVWVRTDHLDAAVRVLRNTHAEFFFANMQTSINGEIQDPDWYKHLSMRSGLEQVSGEHDAYRLNTSDLAIFLQHRIFHANTLVIKRCLLERIGKYWEKISFAEDHNLSYRLADSAKGVIYRKTVTADLDVSPHPSIARTFSEVERNLFGIVAIKHAEASLQSRILRKTARGNRAWRLLELAEFQLRDGRITPAKELSIESLLVHPTKKALKMTAALVYKELVENLFGKTTKIVEPGL